MIDFCILPTVWVSKLHYSIYFVGMQRLVPAQMACFCFVVGGTHLVRYVVFFCLFRPVSCWHKCGVHTILRLLPYILVSSMLRLVCHEFGSWSCLLNLNYHTWICYILGLILRSNPHLLKKKKELGQVWILLLITFLKYIISSFKYELYNKWSDL